MAENSSVTLSKEDAIDVTLLTWMSADVSGSAFLWGNMAQLIQSLGPRCPQNFEKKRLKSQRRFSVGVIDEHELYG